MASRIEWADITAETLVTIEPGTFVDQYGTTNDGPALGVFTGSDGWVIEADSAAALSAWLRLYADALDLLGDQVDRF